MAEKITLLLDERVDITRVDTISKELDSVLTKTASEIEISAEKVERVDSAGLQLLLSFIKKATKLDKTVLLVKSSAEFIAATRLLGAAELLNLDNAE